MSYLPAVVPSLEKRTASAVGAGRRKQQQTTSTSRKSTTTTNLFSSTVSSSNRSIANNNKNSSSSSTIALNLRNAAREARCNNAEEEENCFLLNASVLSLSENQQQQQPASSRSLGSINNISNDFFVANNNESTNNVIDFVIFKIQQELNEIKKKIPIVQPSETTLKEFQTQQQEEYLLPPEETTTTRKRPSPPNTSSIIIEQQQHDQQNLPPPLLYELRSGKRRGSFSQSQILALERDQHRQKLDQVWRCAQGWKSRTKETETSFKKFALSLILEVESDRIVEMESKYRLELIAFEQECWLEEIIRPLIQKLVFQSSRNNNHHQIFSPPQTTKNNNTIPSPLPDWLTSIHQRETVKKENSSAVYKVKDSDLLRALKVAEGRLAELGEPSVRMLTVGKNLVTY